ncbi:DNA cytosine methyltransferase [Clostridioides difficile]|nr:DNA cytosine methyltransferase [Clostridioides difficile]MCP3278069.1 DNA cytosine methyltransferase [Clostridioides difficile]HCQ5967563.1 DNA (cytosine-5-)-methyltransferase [Clostridioides difficile]
MLRVFEAFSGVGSSIMALKNLGINYKIVGVSDVDKNALIAYDAIHNEDYPVENKTKEEMLKEIKRRNIAYNFSTGKSEIPKSEEELRKLYVAHIRNKNYGDIRLINCDDLPDFDFFTCSPPCKNISVAGRQEGFDKNSGTQSSLIWECLRVIENKKPKYIMFENVKNIIGKNHKKMFDLWCRELEKLGYNNYFSEKGYLDGKYFSVPQHRERVIMVSIRKDIMQNFKMPEGKGNKFRLKDILEESVNDKYKISKEKLLLKENMSENIFSIKSRNELIQVGTLNIKGNDANKRVYSSEGICPTLNSMNGGNRQPKILVVKDKYKLELRKLTPLECWRVMGFSDTDFYKAKNAGLSNSKLYERAGRGIVLPMLENIYKDLFSNYIGDKNENHN